jgi:mannose-6-phosphate isomerase-like protein (cupin superfamily)
MKRLAPFALLALGFAAGRLTGPGATAAAQMAVAPAKPMHWSIDDTRHVHERVMARQAPGIPLAMTPLYKMFVVSRMHHDAPVVGRYSKLTSQWDDGEEHARVTDFYVVVGGSGTIVIGGELKNKVNIDDPDGKVAGEFRGQPIEGGRPVRVKAGDWLIVPPHTPHWAQPDPGGLTSLILQIRDDDVSLRTP